MSYYTLFLKQKLLYIPAPPLPLWSSFSEIAERLPPRLSSSIRSLNKPNLVTFRLCVLLQSTLSILSWAHFSQISPSPLHEIALILSFNPLPAAFATAYHSHLPITHTYSSLTLTQTFPLLGSRNILLFCFLLTFLNTFSPFPLLFPYEVVAPGSSVIGPVHFSTTLHFVGNLIQSYGFK